MPLTAYEISMTGLDVEWRRLEVIASNLANMNTVRGTGELGYQPMRLVTAPGMSFAAHMEAGQGMALARGVQVAAVEATQAGETASYEPEHPVAGEDGLVWRPNVDHAGEMTLMMRTTRAYEANLTAASLAQQMYRSALDAGRGS